MRSILLLPSPQTDLTLGPVQSQCLGRHTFRKRIPSYPEEGCCQEDRHHEYPGQ